MNCVIPLSSSNTAKQFARFMILLHVVLAATLCAAQEGQQLTERRTLGFVGPVRSVLTAIERRNPDPRIEGRRKLIVQGMPDWIVFDTQGRRIEFASAFSKDRIVAISKCTFKADATKVCTDSTGQHQESRKQETTLANGTREVTYFAGPKIESREVTSFDEKGRTVAFRTYDSDGRLRSETLFSGDNETTTWKIYDGEGNTALDERTRVPDDGSRLDRWSYDSRGRLVWHLALNSEGALLSHWYDIGYRPKQSSSDSLGVCGPRFCVSYKFDELGSGLMEKVIQYTSGKGSLEPDCEEHFGFDGILDEKVEIRYARDNRGNWTSRSIFVWDATSNQMIEVEQDTRTIEYY
jgi:YD repeat-containing protein